MQTGKYLAMLLLISSVPFAAAQAADSSKASDVRYIRISELIDRVAQRTGRQFVIDPRVRAEVPLAGLDPDKVDFERLLAILRVNQFVAMQENGFVSVVPDANARQLTSPTYLDLSFKALDDELVTVILAGKNSCVAHLVPVLRPLMPQAAHLAADLQSNMLIVSDRASNVRRIGALFERLDRAAPAGQKCTPDAGAR
jgi:general secretion pathway protein D